MKRLILAAATLAGLAGSAFAQNDTPSNAPFNESFRATATSEEKGLIPAPRRAAFTTYVVQQNVPSYAYSSELAVGAVLPEAGVTYYPVPAEYGPTEYRYTVVNSQPVLVEPSTRRIVQVVR